MKKKDKKKLLSLAGSLAFLLLAWLFQTFFSSVPSEDFFSSYASSTATIISTQNKERIAVQFLRHVDGDTTRFLLDEEEITVRYLCVDTEETVHPNKDITEMGISASAYVKHRLENAQNIEIEYDGAKKDKYQRVLAWIWVDDVLLNLELVELGYAKVSYVYDDYKYVNELYEAQERAKKSALGIWEDLY